MRSSYAVPRGTTLVAPTMRGLLTAITALCRPALLDVQAGCSGPTAGPGSDGVAATGGRVHGPNARRVSTLPRSLSRGTRYYSPSTHLYSNVARRPTPVNRARRP